MYFIHYDPLKERLRNRSIDDREALPYFLLFCVLEVVAISIPAIEYKNKWDYISTVLSLLVTIWGVMYVYRRNGGRRGYDLIHKFVVLGWVVAVRFLTGAIPIGLAVYFFAWHFGLTGDENTLFDALFFTAFEIIYYQRLGKHIADTSAKPANHSLKPTPNMLGLG
jgi:hypothetical protein